MRVDIYDIEAEYVPLSSPIWVENELGYKVATLLNNPLIIAPMDKRIFLLYLEMGSLRKVEAVCGISHKTVNIIVHRVRKKILELC